MKKQDYFTAANILLLVTALYSAPRTFADNVVNGHRITPGQPGPGATGTPPDQSDSRTPGFAKVDDKADGWIWSAMQQYDDPALNGGSGHVGGPKSYGAYTFTGTGVDIIVMAGPQLRVDGRRHAVGSMRVSIDGNLKADDSLMRPRVDYAMRGYTCSGLPPGNHVLQIEPEDGWIVVDYITVHTGSGSGNDSSVDATGTSTGGKSGKVAKKALPIPDGKSITLLAMANNQYVAADPTGVKPVTACDTSPAGRDLFEVHKVGDGYITLRSIANGNYVCASNINLMTSSSVVDMSQTSCNVFHWEPNPDGTVSLLSVGAGYYVSADMTKLVQPPLAANRKTASLWESFKITVAD